MKDLKKQTEDYQHSFIIKWLMIIFLCLFIMWGGIMRISGQTKEEVYNYCVEIGIQQPEFVCRQISYETGHLNPAKLGMRNNNLLCFKWGEFLVFDCWQASINYYKCWMERKGIYYYKDLNTLLINEWGAEDMGNYINEVNNTKFK